MKCERCNIEAPGYDLHDYCEHCSKNLCERCMREGKCYSSADGQHEPSDEDAVEDEEPEQCGQCGEVVLGYHRCPGVPT